MNHVSTPRYSEDKETNKRRKLPLVVRQDKCVVDGQNHKQILKDFNVEIDFASRLRRYGKQGKLEIRYDETKNAWCASILVEAGVEETSVNILPARKDWVVY